MKRWGSIVLVCLGILLFLATAVQRMKEVGDAPNPPVSVDAYSQFLPNLTFVKETVLSGSLPLWTPYAALGNPLFAQSGHGLLYPFNWAIFLFDIPTAMLVIQLLSTALGMTGTILYLRHFDLQWPAVAIAAALFGYAVLNESFLLVMGSTLAWLPVVLWLGHRLFNKPSFGDFAGLVVVLTLTFLSGFVQLFYYMSLLLGVYLLVIALAALPQLGIKTVVFRLGIIGLAFFLMVGLVSVQLLPTIELSLHSVRKLGERLYKGEDPFSFPIKWSELFEYYRKTFGSLLLLLPFGVAARKNRAVVLALLASMAYAILFVQSEHVPALALFGKIPLAGGFRQHFRIMPYVNFMAMVLAGMGLSSLWEVGPLRLWDSVTRKLNTVWIFMLVYLGVMLYPAFLMAAGLFGKSSGYAVILLPSIFIILGLLSYRSAYPRSMKIWGIGTMLAVTVIGLVSQWNMIYPVVSLTVLLASVTGVIVLLIFDAHLPSWTKKLTVWVIAILVAFEIFPQPVTQTALAFSEIGNPGYFYDARVKWVKENAGFDRVLLSSNTATYNPNIGNMFQFFNIESYQSLTLARWRNFVRQFTGPEEFDKRHRVELFYGVIDHGPLGLIYGVTDRDPLLGFFLRRAEAFGLASLRYVVTHYRLEDMYSHGDYPSAWKLHFVGDDSGAPFYVYENADVLPRAYLVNAFKVVHSEEESLQAIDEHIAELEHSVVLENGSPSFQSATTPKNSGHVEINGYEVNKVNLQVEADEPSLLVLTDAYYPGWRVFVDKAEKPIWRANSLFRAVDIPAGEHTVTFKYRPASLIWGIVISLLSLVVLASILILGKAKKGTGS